MLRTRTDTGKDKRGNFDTQGIATLMVMFVCSFLLFAASAVASPAPLAFADDEGGNEAESTSPIDNLKNGSYQVEVTMTGGSGKASVESPALLEIEGGKAYVTLVWSSEHYDYMIVDGKKVTPVTTNPTSTFRVPVLVFDEAYEMVGDTTAMGSPHEITYEFTFDSSTIVPYPTDEASSQDSETEATAASLQETTDTGTVDTNRVYLFITIGSLALAAIAIGLTIGLVLAYRQRR